MTAALRYPRLLATQLRVSLATAMQYRADFFVEGLMSLYWIGWNVLPLYVLFEGRATIGNWTAAEALVVIGWFIVLRGLLEGLVSPSLVEVVERIRSGSFDYVLLKPADPQFLASTARFAPWRIVDVLGGIGVVVIAFVQIGRAPAALDVARGVLLLGAGALVMYGLWVMMVSAAFWVVRLDNLPYLLSSVFDTARWPIDIFRGAWRFVFTYILPLAVMTLYPAQAILGKSDNATTLACLAGAAAVVTLARLVWRAAIASYTSASS
jgi:ABC-2 type transport system permease protein